MNHLPQITKLLAKYNISNEVLALDIAIMVIEAEQATLKELQK